MHQASILKAIIIITMQEWQDSNQGLMKFYTPTTYETHFVSCSGEKGGIGAYKTHF
jgi:hypothetical protein